MYVKLHSYLTEMSAFQNLACPWDSIQNSLPFYISQLLTVCSVITFRCWLLMKTSHFFFILKGEVQSRILLMNSIKTHFFGKHTKFQAKSEIIWNEFKSNFFFSSWNSLMIENLHIIMMIMILKLKIIMMIMILIMEGDFICRIDPECSFWRDL